MFHKRSSSTRFFEMESALFSSNYENWKLIRKPLNPTFGRKSIMTMESKMNKHIDRLLEKLSVKVGKGPFDVFTPIAQFDVEEVFDIILDAQFTCTEEFATILNEATNTIGKRFFNPLLYPDFIFNFTSISRNSKLAHEFTKKLVYQLFGNNFDEFVKNKPINCDINNNELKDRRYFIDELCKIKAVQGQKFSDPDIVENIKTILIAGYETQSHTISFTCLLLAMHPEIADKVYEDISEHYERGSFINHEIVKKMSYLDMVIKEVLRLFPVAPITQREAMASTHIDKLGKIPKGVNVLITMHKLHRNEAVWGPEADKFNPDNFLPENMAKRPPFSYLPFGAGSRNCIGLQYASLNLKLALAKVLSTYKFTTKLKYEDIKVKYGISLKLNGQYLVEAHLR